jgi:hypothetical protein
MILMLFLSHDRDQQSSIGKQLEAIKNDGRLLRTRTASQLEEIRNDLIKMAADLRHREQEDDESDQVPGKCCCGHKFCPG